MRAIVLIDGQNLYHMARRAWASGPQSPYAWPSYDVQKLASVLVARTHGRTLEEIRFYTGVPDPSTGPSQTFWHGFWSNKIRYLRSRGVYVYRGRVNAGGQEKGVDVSLALDLVRATYERRYEAAIIVSQDWDFGPAVRLAKGDCQGTGQAARVRVLLPARSRQPFAEGRAGDDLDSDRPGDLRQLSRSEGLSSEEAVSNPALADESPTLRGRRLAKVPPALRSHTTGIASP